MKKSIRTKSKHGNRPPPANPVALQPTHTSPMRWAVLGLCLVLVFGGTWAFLELVVWNVTPRELVGKWVVTEGPQEGATFDFYRSGKMIGRVNQGGQLGIVNAFIRVEGETIFSTTKNPMTREELTTVLHIITLTPKTLVLQDEKGERFNMERAE